MMLWNDNKMSIDVTIGWELYSGNTFYNAGIVFVSIKNTPFINFVSSKD